jgi:hypothetical protein
MHPPARLALVRSRLLTPAREEGVVMIRDVVGEARERHLRRPLVSEAKCLNFRAHDNVVKTVHRPTGR